jgi:hypothetical protein
LTLSLKTDFETVRRDKVYEASPNDRAADPEKLQPGDKPLRADLAKRWEDRSSIRDAIRALN